MLRRAMVGVAVAGTFAFAVPALASAQVTQSISVGSCNSGCTPDSLTFTAGGDSSVAATLNLDPTDGGAVQTIQTQLAAGVLANLSSSTAEGCLTSTSTSASCIVGSGLANTGPVTVTPYLTAPNLLSATATPPGTVIAGFDLVVGPPFNATIPGDLSIQQLSSGALVGVLTSDLSAQPALGGALTQLTLNLNGELNGSPFTSMPTACSPAAPTEMTVTYGTAGAVGPTPASPDVGTFGSGLSATCTTLGYTPTVSGSATTTGAGQGAAVTAVVSQPAGQSNSASTTLSVPETVLAANPAAIALANTTTPVGTAAVTSPLLPLPLTGKAFLTEGAGGLGLSLRLISPFTFTLNGAVSLTGSVTFGAVPDVPISALAVSLTGGPEALFQAPCGQSTGTLSSAFVAQNGATASPTAAFSVSGCPAITMIVGKPKVSGGSLTGLSSGHPKLRFKATRGTNAPKIKSVSVGLPSGLRFHTSKVCTGRGSHRKCTSKVKGLSVSGGTVKSAKVSGGRLVITLKSASGSVSVTVKGPGITETKALKTKVKKHKVKKLTVSVKLTNASGNRTSISLKLPV